MKQFLLSLLVFIIISGAAAQTMKHPLFYRENIVLVDTVNGYYSKTVMQSTTDPRNKIYVIPYSGLRKVFHCRISYYNEDGKLRKYRDANLRDYSNTGDDYISSDRIKCFDLPENGTYQVKYETDSKDLILLSGFIFRHYFPVDTFFYELKVPVNLNFKYRLDLLKWLWHDNIESPLPSQNITLRTFYPFREKIP